MREFIGHIAWVASIIAILGFVPQIWRIHVHKEVRDLSKLSFWMLAVSSAVLFVEAIYLGSGVYIFKQLGALVFALIILWQIRTHEKDEWEE